MYQIARARPIPCLALLALAILPTAGLADKVTLKNGRVQEGLIESEDDKQVVLRMGSGKITLMKTMITSIERAGASAGGSGGASGSLDGFLEGRTIPEAFTSLVDAFRALCKKRDEVARIDAGHVKLEASIKKLAGELKQLEKVDADLGKKLGKIAPASNPALYNKIVDQVNAGREKLNLKRTELYELQKSRRDGVPGIAEYLGSIEALESNLEVVPVAGDEALVMLKDLKEAVAKLNQEVINIPIEKASTPPATLVSVKVNDKHAGRFLVDANVTYTALSHAFAKRLGLFVGGMREGTLTDAKGAEVKLRFFLIDSLQIGECKLLGIDGVVLDKMPREDLDGVLGTNTLGYFAVYVDPETRGVVMQTYRARPDVVEGVAPAVATPAIRR